jgi:hypothetical protein
MAALEKPTEARRAAFCAGAGAEPLLRAHAALDDFLGRRGHCDVWVESHEQMKMIIQMGSQN